MSLTASVNAGRPKAVIDNVGKKRSDRSGIGDGQGMHGAGHRHVQHVPIDGSSVFTFTAEGNDDLVEFESLCQISSGNDHAAAEDFALRIDQPHARFTAQVPINGLRLLLRLAYDAQRVVVVLGERPHTLQQKLHFPRLRRE